ncbi:GDP-mannose 4,6-dehydratase [Nocardioides sp. BP30]|uniref:GDP-mannose 4,6-dehydratase n=1 Tax=Nocardioides sp. BP30 TaxID=3036374 RepID=UPI002468A54F|nr:GDP-mannose 4,6-dehydratase [Nocardioides sp. BP30]WGL52063.1 GDP-mannose 4,6-dehydratase [Nocardioides sp. BP30]
MIALVTGATGQDGIYLSRLLADAGTTVLAGRRSPGPRDCYLAHRLITLVDLDVTDTAAFAALLRARQIDEVYQLAAISSVALSWDDPRATVAVNAEAVEGMLAAVRHIRPSTRFFQASSVQAGPTSPYAASKLAAEGSVADARARGVFAVAGRLANHESPLRPVHFVSRRIARAAAAGDVLDLGDLSSERDWGHARDHVAAMPLLLRLPEPLDADICTGVRHPLRALAEAAYSAAGLDPATHIVETGAVARPADPVTVGGSPEAITAATGWRARTSIAALMAELVAVERRRLASGLEDDVTYLAV